MLFRSKEMLSVSYYGGLSDPAITEYLPVLHDGYAAQRAMQQLYTMAGSAGVTLIGAAMLTGGEALDYIAKTMTAGQHPASIEYKKDGKYHRITKRSW